MSTFQEFLQLRWDADLQTNEAALLRAIERREPWLMAKIHNYRQRSLLPAERSTFTDEHMLEVLSTNPVLRGFFRKDPSKQGFHEKVQEQWIKRYGCPDFTLLSKSTAPYLANGALCTVKKRPTGATKTLDAYSAARNQYAIMKYTAEEGGAQDNQFNDAKHSLLGCVNYLEKVPTATETFLFILDGPYYTKARRDELQGMIPTSLQERITITSAASYTP